MKKMTKKLFVAAVALTALTACSDSNFTEADSLVVNPTGAQGMNTAVLTNASGQQLASVPANFGTYYLDIKTDGIWYIETGDNMEFTPTRMYGKGSTRVPVMIGNNWAGARELSYKVKFLSSDGQTTRAEGGTQTVAQESNTNLAAFEKIVNSNIFVGWSYTAAKSNLPELCTGIEVFDMKALNNTAHVVSSLSPQAKELYYYSHSENIMDKIIGTSFSPGGNFGPVKLDTLGVTVNRDDINHSGHTVVQKQLIRSVYGRELNWANAATLKNADSSIVFNEAVFSNGFRYYKQRYIDQIAAAKDTAAKKAASEEFVKIVGSHFISKALLGCQLDYRIKVDSSKTKKSTEVKVALDFKWQQQVKDTAKVDSALIDSIKKHNANLKNFVFKGNVQVTDVTFNAATSTKAEVKARGGDVERVNILTTGGSLLAEDLARWLLGTEPEKAVLTGLTPQPIYYLFNDSKAAKAEEKNARKALKDYVDKYYSLDPAIYGKYGTVEETK